MLGVIEGIVPSSSALSLPAAPPVHSIPLRLQSTRGAEYHVASAGSLRPGDLTGRPKPVTARQGVASGVFNKACEYVFGW